MKKFEMELLNSEEMRNVQGGYKCSGKGDTVMCAPIVGKIVMCATVQGNCAPRFTSDCDLSSGVVMSCPTFTITKPAQYAVDSVGETFIDTNLKHSGEELNFSLCEI
jgi:hypothetical protein